MWLVRIQCVHGRVKMSMPVSYTCGHTVLYQPVCVCVCAYEHPPPQQTMVTLEFSAHSRRQQSSRKVMHIICAPPPPGRLLPEPYDCTCASICLFRYYQIYCVALPWILCGPIISIADVRLSHLCMYVCNPSFMSTLLVKH